ncbi:MAG TPA: glycerophosphodiester phosphodiesterase [Burkholderiaceae bacterium]|jgi:glycerophosphoryl diester phosphodiesterase|nr:glycerophosphodiester phosphodiesterase [Burkholderiaceae bacterium]
MSSPFPEWPYPQLVAHRGAGRLAPENTLAAFREGARHGFRMIEYDVKLSADDVPILLHDDTLERTSNGTGRAADYRYADLSRFDYGAWHSIPYAGEPLATLYGIAAYTRAAGIYSNIEIKPSIGMEQHTGERIAQLAARLWEGSDLPPLLSSFSEVALAAAGDAVPELPRALLIEEELPQDWRARVARLGCRGLNLNHRYVTREIVRDIRGEGLSLAIWTVNDSARAHELLDWGCNAIITDEVETMAPGRF